MTDAPLAGRPAAPWRTILRQAWPILVSSWAGIVFAVLDTAMVGHASAADLQAMSLGASIYITIFVGLMGVVHALIPIIAQHFGARRLDEAGRAWGQGIWLALILSALGGACLLFPDAWLSLSGDVEPEVRRRVAGYLVALALALPSALLFRTIYATSTAISQTREVMAINVGSIAFKLLFNVWFIFGGLGLPAMGAVGAGINERGMIRRFLAAADLDVFLVASRYTLLEHAIYDDEIREAGKRGASVVVGGAFSSGILATGVVDGAKYEYGVPPADIVARVNRLSAVASSHGVSLAAAALQFPLAAAEVCSVVFGAVTPEEIRANIGHFSAPIPAGFWSDLRSEKLISEGIPLP